MNVPKLLVVDKSVFHSLCSCEQKLCAFVKHYNVLLPHALAIECLISGSQSPDKDARELISRFHAAIKAGANMGYSLRSLFIMERKTLHSALSVVDERATEQFRNGAPNTAPDFIKQEAQFARKDFEQIVESVLKVARALYDNLCKQEELSKDIRKEKHRIRRFEKWIQCADKSMKDILNRLFSEEISSRADPKWITWQRARLYLTYSLDWVFIKNLPGSCEKEDISNNLYDIEYVTYLSRADGLLTNDKKLQVPLAKAAFPKKDLFLVDTSKKEARHVFDNIIATMRPSYRIE
jgi:hypothetical protein